MAFGVDYAWGSPSLSGLKSAGVKFVCRYLSYDSGKNLDPAEAKALSAAGIDIVVVWESTGNRAAQGRSAGVSDAKEAEKQAKACGMPDDRPIYFAVDFDTSGATVYSYFDGVKSVLGVDRSGVYGSYRVVNDLHRTSRAKFLWQTYAWSGGQWYALAQLQQYSNDHTIAGVSCDYDRSTTTDFGQWRVGVSPSLPKHQYATRTLHRGDTGTDVRRLQGFLNKRLTNRGFPKITADGVYGETTEKAKHWATYVLGLPTSVVKREGATAKVQHYIRHPSDRPKTYLERAKERKKENPDQFSAPKPKPAKPKPSPEPAKDSEFRVVQGCPCNKLIAPYIDIVTDGCTVNSIYRGEDAKDILHAHGHHTQAELYATLPKGQANPPGRSTHELRGDGHAYGAPVGAHLEDWQQGFDVNDADVDTVKRHARKLGWWVYQPYSAGSEFHHLNFAKRPKAKGAMRLKIIARRARLPRR